MNSKIYHKDTKTPSNMSKIKELLIPLCLCGEKRFFIRLPKNRYFFLFFVYLFVCFIISNTAIAEIVLSHTPEMQGPAVSGQVFAFESEALPRIYENALARASGSPAPSLNVTGIGFSSKVPSDSVGAAGPNHYVQMVNSAFAVYDKNGNRLVGPTDINTLWRGKGNACELRNDGDPIVLYDSLADRWLLSQLAHPNGTLTAPFYMCMAISQTPDPAGKYYLYAFEITDVFPDYPKLAVWPDAYYMSTNDSLSDNSFTVGAFAFDRGSMLKGQAAAFQKFKTSGINVMLPSTLDGSTPPPSGSPNYFYTMMDGEFWTPLRNSASDHLEVWEFKVDFSIPANSKFAKALDLPISPFNYTVCGYLNMDCIPQPSPGVKLDAVSEWPMWRLQYRNFGTYEAMVGNFTVDTDGTQHAGIRWFELRKSGNNAWTVYQEGTLAPDDNHRWNGSLAMDKEGNIALGYSIAGSSLNPGIRYSTRLLTDTPNTMGNEISLVSNGGVQSIDNRWGDYSSMSVDPADNCTFWYTNQYIEPFTGLWNTRIGAFKIPTCGCSAILSANLKIHIPFLTYSGYFFWADFTLIPNTLDFALTNYGPISDASAYSSCTPVTLSPDLKLSVPALLYAGYSFHTDFTYSHDAVFTLTGYGLN